MKKALLVIDYTYDFVASDGKLTCGEPGQALDNKISSLIQKFMTENEFVVFANDLHEEDDPFHPETKLFPLIIFAALKDVIYLDKLAKFISFTRIKFCGSIKLAIALLPEPIYRFY